jgi:hypothetical protein
MLLIYAGAAAIECVGDCGCGSNDRPTLHWAVRRDLAWHSAQRV